MSKQISNAAKKELVKRLYYDFIKAKMGQIALAVVFMITFAASNSVQPILIKLAFDKIFAERDPFYMTYLPIAIIAVFLISGVSNYLSNITMGKVGYDVVRDMQKKLFSHFINLDVSFHLNKSSGELVSRLVNDIAQIKVAVSNLLVGVFKQGFNVIGLTIVIFYQNAELALVGISIFVLIIYPISRVAKRLYKLAGQEQNQIAKLTTKLAESFRGIRTVKAYRREDFEISRINKQIDNMMDLKIKSIRVAGINSPIISFLAGLSVACVLWHAGNMIDDGRATQGEVVAFVGALIMLSRPLRGMGGLSNIFFTAIVSAQRYFAMYDMKNSVSDAPDAKELQVTNSEIEIRNLTFSYTDDENRKTALKNISLTIPAGKKVALVGHSGSGKSTILNLLLRFFDPQQGEILIDGQDIRNVTMGSLRDHISLVTQDIFLFDDTIAANIAYGKEGITQADIEEAAKIAAAHDFIMALPEGYNTIVGEAGIRLSGGQKQRISIARAVLRNAPILLLDEATSALDNRSEKEFQQALDKMMVGKTTIIVAHRLSTVVNSDVIYVMDEGQIKEQGTHKDLLENSAIYSELYN